MEQPTIHHPSVVFVDDNSYTNEYHKVLAAEYDPSLDLKFFTDPANALGYLKRLSNHNLLPKLLVVDIYMPQMNGHTFVEEVKSLAGYQPEKTKITYVTSSQDFQDALQADDLGVSSLYWKPMDEQSISTLFQTTLASADG